MPLHRRLAALLLEQHPGDAARVLEALPVEEIAGVVADAPLEAAAAVLCRLNAHAGAGVLGRLDATRAGAVLGALDVNVAANLLRRLEGPARDERLATAPPARARALATMLRFPESTAGALMDPQVLALADDLTAKEALERVRGAAEHARYNLYVVNREQVLVGVLNLRELLLARPPEQISAFMHVRVHQLPAHADRRAIVSHPGWREVHALPVVDAGGVFLGAIRFGTLRRIEEELRGGASVDGSATIDALGDLFSVGVGGLIDGLATTVITPAPRTEPGE